MADFGQARFAYVRWLKSSLVQAVADTATLLRLTARLLIRSVKYSASRAMPEKRPEPQV